MAHSTILAATWRDGLFVFSAEDDRHELAGQAVKALVRDPGGGALAIVDGHSLCRRTPEGEWNTIVTSEFLLACCVTTGDAIYIGTDDAHMLRVRAHGQIDTLGGFDAVQG